MNMRTKTEVLAQCIFHLSLPELLAGLSYWKKLQTDTAIWLLGQLEVSRGARVSL